MKCYTWPAAQWTSRCFAFYWQTGRLIERGRRIVIHKHYLVNV